MSDDESRTNLSIAVADDYVGRLPEVVDRLRSAGLTVDQVLDGAGVVTGSIDTGKVATLSSIEGVAGVERVRHFQLPPPGVDLQ